MKKILKWLNGKKVVIGSSLLVGLRIAIWCGLDVPLDVLKALELLFLSLTGVGLGHKAIKNKTAIAKIIKRNTDKYLHIKK